MQHNKTFKDVTDNWVNFEILFQMFLLILGTKFLIKLAFSLWCLGARVHLENEVILVLQFGRLFF